MRCTNIASPFDPPACTPSDLRSRFRSGATPQDGYGDEEQCGKRDTGEDQRPVCPKTKWWKAVLLKALWMAIATVRPTTQASSG
jgi:hypothetical protein